MTQLTGWCFTAQQQQTLCLFCPCPFKTISQIGYQQYVKRRWKAGRLKDADGFSKSAWWPCRNHCPTVEANGISCLLNNCTDKLYGCCNNKCLKAFERVKPLALHFPCLRKEEGSFQAKRLGVLQVDVLLVPLQMVVASSGGMDAPQQDPPRVAKHDPGAGVLLS